jgi:phospholipid/cholesterol/gamma-HCH transport system substrate-binding protein
VTRRIVSAVVVLLVVLAAVVAVRSRGDSYTITASFPRTIGLYPGDDVRVVGVPVGHITKISPEGDHVDVTMQVDDDAPVAADTGAVIVPPGVLSSRYVQLTKPWLQGPKLADGARIDADRTSAPLELDDVTRQLGRFLTALAPTGEGAGSKGQGSKGALASLVDSSAKALAGNGTTLRQSLSDLADALDVVGQSRGDIVATVEQLQQFVTALAGSDQAIRTFEHSLADVSGQLAGQRAQLRATIRNVAATVKSVHSFVRTNHGQLTTDVADLARITTTLKDRERELTEIVDLAPVGTEAIFGAANLNTGVLEARVDLTALLSAPQTHICQLLTNLALPLLCPPGSPSVPHDAGSGD